MRNRSCAVGVGGGLALLLAASATPASGQSYDFVSIADVFGEIDRFQDYSINDNGTVAFHAHLDAAGGDFLFTGSGGELKEIAQPPTWFSSYLHPSIHSSGTVVFLANLDPPSYRIQASRGGPVSTIATSVGPPFKQFGAPKVSDRSAVAFSAILDTDEWGIFVWDAGFITIADSTGPLGYMNYPSINTDGTVAFRTQVDGGGEAIYVGNGGPLTLIADTAGPFSKLGPPSINDAGTVAFRAELDSGGEGIYTGSGGEITTIVDDSGDLEAFGDPAINASGRVVFHAWSNDPRGRVLLASDGGRMHTIVRSGDTLFGRVLDTVFFAGDGCINDNGDVAFKVSSLGIAVAVPQACYADCNGDSALDFFDFLCYQNVFAAGEPQADCDGSGSLDFFDFLCFQNGFAAGCS